MSDSSPWDEWQATLGGRLDVHALFDRMGDDSPVTYAARKEAEVARLRAERQAVLDCVNLYGDTPLHKALDAIGWPHVS